MQQGAYFYAFLKFDLAGLVVHRSFHKGDFVAVWILGAVNTFLPHLLGQLLLSGFDVVAFGEEARLVG